MTDHRPLVWLHVLKDPASRLARWRIKLSEYEYDIAYKPGRVNSNADALSWDPCDNGGINIDSLHVEESQKFVLVIVKVSSVGNGLKDLSWSTVEQVFKQHFLNTGLSIIVCSAEIVIPPVNQRINY